MELVFNQTLVRTLAHALGQPVLTLALEAQFGALTRWDDRTDPFWARKAQYARPRVTATQCWAGFQRQRVAFQAAVASGVPLRLWWSDTAEDQLGQLWVFEQLAAAPNPLTAVHVPLVAAHGDGAAATLTTMAAPRELDEAALRHLTVTATPQPMALRQALRQALHWQWQQLQDEAAPVRIALEGQLIGVAEDFFDRFLAPHRPNESATAVLGRTMGQTQLNVPEWWWRYRLVQTGRAAE
ncbi:DUF3658 domain-containing protein [Lacticaseibacillus daqingensis]|uniref:DUF3658 domain-containing protein n=1 Tax=Lacticaseibacillus daqingensis TaxID=2486014 RepID=UPI000F76C7B5|nr:DUF3658 domain-containing protein [Lacticaseibacillus daqingensis]